MLYRTTTPQNRSQTTTNTYTRAPVFDFNQTRATYVHGRPTRTHEWRRSSSSTATISNGQSIIKHSYHAYPIILHPHPPVGDTTSGVSKKEVNIVLN